nr:nucleolar protein 58-like [Lytechinus pictus]
MAEKGFFKVKFNWTWRLRSQENEKAERNDCEEAGGNSRNARYVRKMKATQPTRFKQHLEKDAARKRKAYLSIQDKTEKHKKEQRQKWSSYKQVQRDKGEKRSQRNNVKKRFKDLSPEEKKEYFKLKMKASRARVLKQKKTSMQQKDRRKKAATCAEEKVKNMEKQPDEEACNTATKN